ncbi:MAG: ParB N-terminal domain-containing protein [Bacteroidales bacterium]|nr:ParB N-terminal domain-containing protein [Bacteroidales bacterium]
MNGLDINIGQSATNINKEKLQKTTTISIDDIIDNPLNKKIYLDSSVEEMIKSLKLRELITPIMVVRTSDCKYKIISGHRRCEACRKIFSEGGVIKFNGIEHKGTMPAIIHEPFLSEEEETKAIVDANNQREKNAQEKKNEAVALYGKLKELKEQGEFPRGSGEITQVVADQLDVSKNTVKNWLNESKEKAEEKTAKIGCFQKNEKPKENKILLKIKSFSTFIQELSIDELDEETQKQIRDELEKISNLTNNI